MKMQLEASNRVPYGGMYIIKDRLTGVEVKGTNFPMLMDMLYRERKANGHPTGIGFEEEVERWVCEEYPKECVGVGEDLPRKRQLGMADILNGLRVMLAFKAQGSPIVSQEEASRRAKICATCPFNVVFSKPCAGLCAEIKQLVVALVGNLSTPHDSELKSCAVCGCYTAAAVWLPLDVQCHGVNDTMRKQFANVKPACWKQCVDNP